MRHPQIPQAVFESLDRDVMRLAAAGHASSGGGSGSGGTIGDAGSAAAMRSFTSHASHQESSVGGGLSFSRWGDGGWGAEHTGASASAAPAAIPESTGSCAVVALLFGDALIIANVGDCEAWLCR